METINTHHKSEIDEVDYERIISKIASLKKVIAWLTDYKKYVDEDTKQEIETILNGLRNKKRTLANKAKRAEQDFIEYAELLVKAGIEGM